MSETAEGTAGLLSIMPLQSRLSHAFPFLHVRLNLPSQVNIFTTSTSGGG